jgi:L-aminopeptidase/D-esterase-like protein
MPPRRRRRPSRCGTIANVPAHPVPYDTVRAAALLGALCVVLSPGVHTMPVDNETGLTAVAGLKVGHHTMTGRPTGCTVVLAEGGVIAGVDVRGAAPGTRETDLLSPVNLVDRVHAIVLAGGSAFGLDAASGVMRYLDERGVGFPTSAGVVPIVPSAILFDLAVGTGRIRPGADCGYAAASAASADTVAEGSVGAGAGATVGKMFGMDRAMKGGVGSAAITLPNGLTVAALVAVNAYGDIIDPATGRIIAGVRTPDGRGLADARALVRAGATSQAPVGESSTIGVVATNARLTKTQATKVAQMAHDGLARAIAPIHTQYDGDTLFALATGAYAPEADVSTVGALAADAVALAVLRGVRHATGLPGLPAVRDLAGTPR